MLGNLPVQNQGQSSTMGEQVLDPRYAALICYNCGEPGHFMGNCIKPKVCFICGFLGHPVNNCAAWVDLPPDATFFDSAAKGLGFFHVEVPTAAETQWLNFKNCGLIEIKSGSVTVAELEQKLSGIFCRQKQWPWQIREVDQNSFLVRFPP